MNDDNLRPRVGVGVMVLKGGLLLGKPRGSHGEGEFAYPAGHLEHLETFAQCGAREVKEETGLEIGPHYVDLAFAVDWVRGEPQELEPGKREGWAWYPLTGGRTFWDGP